MIGKYQRFEIIDECSCSRAVAPHDHAPHQGMKYYEISKRKSYGLRSFVVRLCGAASKRKASRITWSLHLGPRIATALMLSGLVSRELDAAERRQRWRALLPTDNWELRCSTLSEKKKGKERKARTWSVYPSQYRRHEFTIHDTMFGSVTWPWLALAIGQNWAE